MSSTRLLCLLLSALLVSRLTLLLTGIDAIYFDEELTTGLIAKNLIEGLRTSFFDYQLADHHAGSLLMGILVSPLFLLLGQNLFVLKLAPLMVYAGAMALWFRCCDRYLGRQVAILVALLFICSPQLLTRFSLITVGFHPETIIFTAAATLALFKIVIDGEQRARWFMALGAVCGLGSWFAYIFIPTVATCMVFWFAADRRFLFRRSFAIFAVGFVVGGDPVDLLQCDPCVGRVELAGSSRWRERKSAGTACSGFRAVPFHGVVSLICFCV